MTARPTGRGWVGVLIGIVAGVLTYGYWHASTHGSIYIYVYDPAIESSSRFLRVDRIALLDRDGRELARGASDPDQGVIAVEHPEVGTCMEEARAAPTQSGGKNAWQRCFAKHATWVVTWARDVRFVDLVVDTCEITSAPVAMRASMADWWMWWVPLPHMGGKPYSSFSLLIELDSEVCRVPSP